MTREWYSRGLRFECTQCGGCCTGPPGFVSFTREEGRGLAAALGVSEDEFLERYTEVGAEGRSLREVRTEHGFDCVFLDRSGGDGRAVCGVYAARPAQCRTFPWWPEHLRSRKRWEALKRSCEGVGRGGFVPIEAIRIQRDRQVDVDAARVRERDNGGEAG